MVEAVRVNKATLRKTHWDLRKHCEISGTYFLTLEHKVLFRIKWHALGDRMEPERLVVYGR